MVPEYGRRVLDPTTATVLCRCSARQGLSAAAMRRQPTMTLQMVLDDIRKRPGSGEVISIIDPVTEEQIAEFTDGGEEAINEAVERARNSFESGVWSGLPGKERAKILWRIADLIDEYATHLVDIDSLNTGMTTAHAHTLTTTSAEFFRYYAGWCTKVNGIAHDVQITGGVTGGDASMHAYTIKEP